MKIGWKHKIEVVHYFVDHEGILDKNRIIQKVLEITENLSLKEKKKLELYLVGTEISQRRINQIILNEIVKLQMNSDKEKATKKVFEDIKGQWVNLVEWNSESLLFQIHQQKVSELLFEKTNSNNNLCIDLKEEGSLDQTSLLRKINQDLLQDAIVSHAFAQQSVDILSTMIHLEMYEKFESSSGLKAFLKYDLEGNHLNEKLAVDYGIHCKLENDMLVFSGTPKSNFKGRTLVVQIQTIQWRILKEIWIHENPGGARNTTIELSSRSESSLRGHAYEIY